MLNLDKPTDINKLPVRRWLTLVMSMVMYNAFVIHLILAVLLGPLNEKFGWDVGTLLLVYTLMMVMSAPLAIIIGKVRDVTGDRTILILGASLYGIGCILAGITSSLPMFFIAIGVVASAGINAIITGFVHNIGVLFPDKPGFATGMYYAGAGFISMLVIPVAAYFAESYSPTVVLVALGVAAMLLCFILTPLLAIPPENYTPKGWKPKEAPNSLEAPSFGGVQVGWKKLLLMPSVYLFVLAFAATDLICEAFNANFSLVAQEMANMDEMTAAWMGSLLAFGTAIGGLVMGFLADRFGAVRSIAIMAALAGVVVLGGLLIGVTVPVFAAISIMVGLSIGVMTVLMPVITMESYGDKNFGVNFGIIGISIPLAALVGPQLTVVLPHETWFTLCAGASILAAVLFILGNKSIKNFKKNQAHTME